MTHADFKQYGKEWNAENREWFRKTADGKKRTRSSQRYRLEDAILDFQATDWSKWPEEEKNRSWVKIVHRLKAYR